MINAFYCADFSVLSIAAPMELPIAAQTSLQHEKNAGLIFTQLKSAKRTKSSSIEDNAWRGIWSPETHQSYCLG